MGQTLFPPGPGAGPRRVSLVRLSAEIARAAADVGRVAVEGEVVRPKAAASGRLYFTLRDRAAQITVTCPSARLRRCRAVHGERVAVTGALSWTTGQGQLLLVAEEVAPVGAGAIAAAIEDTRRRLAADGLLDRPRRRIPRLPEAIAVVCGTDAAVRADVQSVVAARFPGYPVRYVEVTVSGSGAAQALAEAVVRLDRRPEVEVIVLARGGGDPAQLLPFSDEELCRAIAASGTPVVTAIGHEGDRPLCDEVADLRCATPSLAAAAIVPSRLELEGLLDGLLALVSAAAVDRLDAHTRRLATLDGAGALGARLGSARARLGAAGDGVGLLHPRRRVAQAAAALARVGWERPLPARCQWAAQALVERGRTLDALSPQRVLERGYAVVRGAGGGVLRRAGQTAPGEELGIQLSAGGLTARVTAVDEVAGAGA